MAQQHIDNDTLDLFVKTTSCSDPANMADSSINSELYNDILDHLATCEECRDQLTMISTLHTDWPQICHQYNLSDDQQQMICDYIDGLLATEETEKVKALIQNQPDAMRASLHYQSHVQSMAAKLPRQERVQQLDYSAKHSQDTIFTDLLCSIRQFFSLRSPMIFTMTATAAVFIAVFLLTQSPEIDQNQTVIASYQDNPTIQFTAKNKLPGVGFFSQSGNFTKAFEDIRIELVSENTVKISWPEVDGAELYKMRIQVFNQGKKSVLKETSTQTSHASFLLENENQVFTSNRRYQWVLYGNTADGRAFHASGGFVINKARAE